MTKNERIQRLLSAKIENTEIVGAVYENSKTFVPQAPSLDFYRVLCHASYEDGSFVRHEVWLPDAWNGVFLGIGNGGMAGSFHHASILSVLRRGYAVAQTDMGTSDGRSRGIGNPALWRDFGWRATHEMTLLAKKLIALHYGGSADFSYFWGGSTGGQQAMSLAQRFPDDYDGIIAGVHANNRVALHTYFLWNHVHAKRLDRSNLFTAQELLRLTASVVEFFQQHADGLPGDGFITFPWLDAATISDLLAFLREKGFSDEQLCALEAIYSGPIDPETERQIYSGMPIGSEHFGGLDMHLGERCHNDYLFFWALGEGFDPFSFDFAHDFRRVRELLSPDLDANDPDLTAFRARGGKLLAFSGSADPIVPFPDAVAYFERVTEAMGGYDAVSSFYRYFIFPGKDHGAGGDGSNREWGDEEGRWDLLDTLRAWREKGQAPDRLFAARVEDQKTVFARPIAPYGSPENPMRARMKTCEFL